MRYRKPKRSYVLPVVTTLAVAAPLAALTHSPDFRPTGDSESAVPTELAEVALGSAPDITLPLHDFTGLDLPDLHLSDLRMLQSGQPTPLPTNDKNDAADTVAPQDNARSSVSFIADPTHLEPGTTPDTPALSPGAIGANLVNQVGAQVKELVRDTPFSVVAFTADDLAGTDAKVRARQPDGNWGQWYAAEAEETDRSDNAAPGGVNGTEPVYVGATNAVQVLVTRKQASTKPPGGIEPAAAQLAAPSENAAPTENADPAATPEGTAPVQDQPLTAVLIDPGKGASDGGLSDIAAPIAAGAPKVITRAQWGADESIRCEDPTYDDGLGGVTVHHTAGRNDYSKEESAGIVRGIYAYHAKTLGWCDIGYNALVDKYGQVFEGRFGGLDRPVQGAHAGGFNENTSGVALMGNHETEPPTDAALQSIGEFVGWRTKVAGLDPKGSTTMYSEGTDFTAHPKGEAVQLPIVFAHRDVGTTTCPGDAAYALMDKIRDIAANTQGSGGGDRPSPATPQRDLAALATLADRVLAMVRENVVAKHWADTGGADGPLGAPESEPAPTIEGRQYAKFANGYVYSTPDGQAVEVVGAMLDKFLQLGADSGMLGLPLTNQYAVPEGLRADFEHGSLILNQASGAVSTVWKTFNENYYSRQRQTVGPSIVAGPGPAPEPQAAPAPEAAAPGVESAPHNAPAPEAVAPEAAPSADGEFAPDAQVPAN
ncbi:N-acetylmuramoyl-L-alanine amidase [Nocardia callitridis]|uniref:Peptidoglycan recognition protein family domain-containing protein n=1 Tax=Nocardia callitridis TaxID=648753 RepID=A0ABP9K0R1_9NOCA